MSNDRIEFTKGAKSLATGVGQQAQISFGKSMIKAVDRGFSPITPLREVTAERTKEQENTIKITRDVLTQGGR